MNQSGHVTGPGVGAVPGSHSRRHSSSNGGLPSTTAVESLTQSGSTRGPFAVGGALLWLTADLV